MPIWQQSGFYYKITLSSEIPFPFFKAEVVELADTWDSKSQVAPVTCGFKSRPRHTFLQILQTAFQLAVFAMSAATLLACACDKIIMAKHSAVGSIDPQNRMYCGACHIKRVWKSPVGRSGKSKGFSDMVRRNKKFAVWNTGNVRGGGERD